MDDEAVFLNEIARQPEEETNRQVYADWLEDHGDRRAEYVRLQMKLERLDKQASERKHIQQKMRRLAKKIDPEWLMELEQAPIENCLEEDREKGELAFEFKCPKRWSHLSATEDADVRFCEQCKQPVFFCHSIDEANHLAVAGACVAIESTLQRKPGDLRYRFSGLLGRISIPERLGEYYRKRYPDEAEQEL